MRSAELAARASSDALEVTDSGADVCLVPDSPEQGRIWVGYDEQKLAVAYFETPNDHLPDTSVSQVVDLTTVQTKVEGALKPARTIKVICTVPKLNEVFWTLMDGVIKRVIEGSGAGSAIQEAIVEWRSLLSRADRQLSNNEALGLYAELKALTDAYQAVGSPAVQAWQVDPQSPQDFITTSARVEVKASVFQNLASVGIHGLQQMRVPEGASLTLAVAVVQKHVDGESLDEVLNALIDSGAPAKDLYQKLTHTAFVPGAPGNKKHRFFIDKWHFWDIDHSSPVLTPDILPDAVRLSIESVNYRLQLGSLEGRSESFDWTRLANANEADHAD